MIDGRLARRSVALFAGAAVASLAIVGVSSAARQAPTKLAAALTVKAEVPAQAVKAPNGTGAFTATLTKNSNGSGTLVWKLTYKGLSGPALAAHIHFAKVGKAGGVIVPLCAPCTTGVHHSTKVSATIVRELLNGSTYVNVHTKKNPAGEIRGQVKP